MSNGNKMPLPVLAYRAASAFYAVKGVSFLIVLSMVWVKAMGNLYVLSVFSALFISMSLLDFLQAYGFWKQERWAAVLFATNIVDFLVTPALLTIFVSLETGFILWISAKILFILFIYMNRNFLTGKYFSIVPYSLFAVSYLAIILSFLLPKLYEKSLL